MRYGTMTLDKTFEIDLYLQITKNEFEEAFPNVVILFIVYLSMFVSNCKGIAVIF